MKKVRLGGNQKDMLEFYSRCNGWHTYNIKHQATKNALSGLVKKGLMEVNSNFPDMARITVSGKNQVDLYL